jgi:hypothetical protein
MATIVNNPPANTDRRSGSGFLFGIILLIIAVILFVYYGLPALGNAGGQGTAAPQVNVPGKIDVNVNQPK